MCVAVVVCVCVCVFVCVYGWDGGNAHKEVLQCLIKSCTGFWMACCHKHVRQLPGQTRVGGGGGERMSRKT